MSRQSAYCKCGASIQLTIKPDKVADRVLAIWREQHQGEGHGKATPKQAAAARRKQAEETLKEAK